MCHFGYLILLDFLSCGVISRVSCGSLMSLGLQSLGHRPLSALVDITYVPPRPAVSQFAGAALTLELPGRSTLVRLVLLRGLATSPRRLLVHRWYSPSRSEPFAGSRMCWSQSQRSQCGLTELACTTLMDPTPFQYWLHFSHSLSIYGCWVPLNSLIPRTVSSFFAVNAPNPATRRSLVLLACCELLLILVVPWPLWSKFHADLDHRF